ncbi:hypothetical protein ACT8ZV_22375 [Nocardioides sp. MAHUQ-72]|uniref:hypothetical protein n=1 Tax=unclassified Nocardioides TaxID=2615069 RepID=UPI00361980C1
MALPRKIVTLHSPVPKQILDDLLTCIEQSLDRTGASRVWIDGRFCPELVVMAEFADVPADGSVLDGDESCGEVLPDLPAPRQG